MTHTPPPSGDMIAPSYRIDGITIPPDATLEEWEGIHRNIIMCRKASRVWLNQSRAYASERWGDDYVANTEAQLELDLGILPAPKPPTATLNPSDKSSAIVTIEGISQSFTLWHRKMVGEIETWDRERLTKALALVEPIEAQAKHLRELLAAKESA